MILALAGGVGGAKLAHGLAMVLPPDDLTVVVNTGDDFEYLGMHVSPDLDTVMYTLSGLADQERGWGLSGETWAFMDALGRLGTSTWFRLGDKDLATHVERTRRLHVGEPLHAITTHLCRKLGVRHLVAPMSDQAVRTYVRTGGIAIKFQHYFVRDRCEPVVEGIEFRGANEASPTAAFDAALRRSNSKAIIICPSNPYLSIAPILAIPEVQRRIAEHPVVVAVSPIIGGLAIKGPAAKIMRELGVEPSALAVAQWYRGLAKVFVIDHTDASQAPQIEGLGLRVLVTDALMRDEADRARLARECIAVAQEVQ